ncbi:MAG: shikimate dehydrogenase [Sedimentisphaerales bacterium]|nr:shikimate dehydrogenase [Sedimentisphaerales bacterium]
MNTKLTVPIAAKDLDQAKKQVKRAISAGAEALELRTDYLENLNAEMVKGLIAFVNNEASGLPIIVTCRDQKQGGVIDYPQEQRVDVLICALKAGAEFIDFEYNNFLIAESQKAIKNAISENSKARLILSAHNFETKFPDINKLHHEILNTYPQAISKLVYTANHINDCFEAFDLLHQSSNDKVVFCMGQAGLISRIIAKKLNSFITFASIDDQSATAPGQLTIEQFKKLFRYDNINKDTELFGVIANPVGHSLSPAIHNACFGEKQMNKLYLPLLVEGGQQEFYSFLNNIIERKWLNFAGFSVTIPHKQSALEFVRTNGGFVKPLAEKIGAVNTIIYNRLEKVKNGGASPTLRAYNTDYSAALDAVTSTLGIDRNGLREMPVAVVGAGGVARAIVAGLSDAGAKIHIYNRTIEKAEKLADEFNCGFASLDDLKDMNARLVVNCTSIGMHPNIDATPVPQECLKSDMAVFDTVYNPVETLLLRQASQAGAKIIDGVSMFVNQGMAQFKLFTNIDGSAELMRRIIYESLSNQ